jgi:hypothetical protein
VLAGVPRARIADGLLFPVLATAVTVWFVAIPGFRDGDDILTAAVALDCWRCAPRRSPWSCARVATTCT